MHNTVTKLYIKGINVKQSYSTWTSFLIFAYVRGKKNSCNPLLCLYPHLQTCWSKQGILPLTHQWPIYRPKSILKLLCTKKKLILPGFIEWWKSILTVLYFNKIDFNKKLTNRKSILIKKNKKTVNALPCMSSLFVLNAVKSSLSLTTQLSQDPYLS